MKNLKQLVLPCYKLEMAMSVEAWYFLHGSTDGICNLTYLLSLLSKMTVSKVQSTKRGLGYAVHPGQVDSSMLVLAKEWGIGNANIRCNITPIRFESLDVAFAPLCRFHVPDTLGCSSPR